MPRYKNAGFGDSPLTIQQQQIAIDLSIGYRVRDVAKKFGVSDNTIYRWLTEKDFSEMVNRIGAEAVRAGEAWASERYQCYLDVTEAIALDEEKSPRDRLHALEMLLKRAERQKESYLQQKITLLEQAVFGADPVDVIAEEVNEELSELIEDEDNSSAD